MKKKIVFRKWLNLLLNIIVFISVIVLLSDCADTGVFLLTHGIALLTLTLSVTLLFKYGRGYRE